MLKYLPPRSFCDLAVPADKNRRPLLADGDYDDYVAWLADYLHATEIQPHPRQSHYALSTDALDPGSACFRISDDAALAAFHLELLEMDFENGLTSAHDDTGQRRFWNDELSPEEKEMETYEEYALREPVWRRIREEWLEKRAARNLPSLIDIPYRALLARILKRVPIREERIEMLKSFFQNYHETAAQ